MQTKTRMANLEGLRCIAMLMVVVLHFLGKGGLLSDFSDGRLTAVGAVGWLMEGFCIVAVNLYMLLTGYFLCESNFKPRRLIQIMLQLWTYSIGVGLLAAAFGLTGDTPVDTYYLLTLLFPVSMKHYWFLTAYVYLLILTPFLCKGVRAMTKAQHISAILILLCFFSLGKSILPVRFEMDSDGYDCLWYLTMFLIAAYVRRFGLPLLEKKRRGILLYMVCCLAVSVLSVGIRLVTAATGRFSLSQNMFIHYNNLLTVLAAVGLFSVFLKCKGERRVWQLLSKISPYCLGVYLLHENIGVRYSWQKWFSVDQIDSVPGLVLTTALAAVTVFAVGICVETVRVAVIRGITAGLSKLPLWRRLMQKLEAWEESFRLEK